MLVKDHSIYVCALDIFLCYSLSNTLVGMIENCKIKLIFKNKLPVQVYHTINHKSKSNQQATYAPFNHPEKMGGQKEGAKQLLAVKTALVQQLKPEPSPGKTFHNSKITESMLTPYGSQSEYEYCLTFNYADRRKSMKKLQCQGTKAHYSSQKNGSSSNFNRAMSKQLSSRTPQIVRASTSEYLSQKRTGYVELQPFQRRKPFSINPNNYQEAYMQKLKIQLDFYFKVQFANRLSADLSLSHPNPPRIRVYVGPGNNQFMIQQILRKRFWYQVVNDAKKCQFYWTQNDMDSIHQHQKSGEGNKKYQNAFIQTGEGQRQSSTGEGQRQSSKNNMYRLFISKEDQRNVEALIDKQGYQFVYPEVSKAIIITNHMPNNSIFNERKHLLKLLQDYYQKEKYCDPWHVLPKTYFICNPSRADIHFYTFTVLQNKKKLWLIKPGERSNHQNQVQLLPAAKIMEKLRKILKHCDEPWSFLLQEYIERPFLYKGRKFDLHHFVLLTSIGGVLRVYWYYQGYVRTSSMPFGLKDLNPIIHFTSDSLQATAADYGHYEPANKMTYNDFQRYLQSVDPYEPHSFHQEIIPQMKKITLDLILACHKQLDPLRRSNFELIGLDFMLDHRLKVYLTGTNTNPSLTNSNPVMGKLLPSIVQQTLWLGVDPFLPPKSHFPAAEKLKLGNDPFNSLRFQCIFDESEGR